MNDPNDFIELEIEAGNITAKEIRLLEDSIYLKPVSSLPLSQRAYKCLVNALPSTDRPDEERTIGEVMRRIPHISGVRGCGYPTAKEVYDVFQAAGINVDHWADDIKLPYVKAREPLDYPFPNLNKRPQIEAPVERNPYRYDYDDSLDDFFDETDYTTGVLYRKGKRVIIELSKERKRKK